MAYIIKNTSALLNTRLTDIGRQRLSEGNFNIAYFQIGDSEVCYNVIPNYNHTNNAILEAAFNAQNGTQQPQTNKMHVKYPYYVKGFSGNTYGIPTQDSVVSPVYNTAQPRGFFTGTTNNWSAFTNSAYTVTSNYTIDMCNLCGTNTILLNSDFCEPTTGTPKVGDYAVIYYDGVGGCGNISGSFPVLTYRIQEVNVTSGILLTLDREIPWFSGAQDCYDFTIENPSSPTETYSYYDCSNNYIQNVNISGLTTIHVCAVSVDSNPNLNITQNSLCPGHGCCGVARVLIYPSGMTELYDTITPMGYWTPEVINFESTCDYVNTDVKVWNMNIPWSVSPAGINNNLNEDYTKFGSSEYLGSKEYFGYMSNSGQTFNVNSTMTGESTDTFYYNSFDEIVEVEPYEQKAIAIVHYTNNAVDNFYGEKFALEPFNAASLDTTGFARNFKVTIPWLMWHKNNLATMGEVFYVDPNVGQANYFEVKYMQSSKNEDMNNPGLRYYHLWDTHLNSDGNPSRVGKVFPDLKTIVFDDEEIVAALSYKSNRNWTLPAPKLSLLTPNTCDASDDDFGLLGNEDEYLYITYRFNGSNNFTNSLHSNYYTKIQGPHTGCTSQRQDVAIKFGDEFPFMNQCCYQGFVAEEFMILAQVVTGATTQPNPAAWKEIEYTSQLASSFVNGFITSSGLTNNTFTLSYNQYYTASTYDLGSYINLPQPTGQSDVLTFGDEYFFYGNIETDIQATIYELRFLCNVPSTQFNNTSNPSWTPGTKSYVTEVGLFDYNKDLMVITKLQSPVLRQGTQQFAIKIDF